jgi:hypothetical protein
VTAHPAHHIPAGSFVTAEIDGAEVLCLKAERVGRDYLNHYLVPLDPLAKRDALALVYIDPDQPLVPAYGAGMVLGEARTQAVPQVGDVFTGPMGTQLKVLDDPRAQKLFAYVDLASGQVRPRLERHAGQVMAWWVSRE